MNNQDSSPKVILIGPPGAGKSTIGKALARELKFSFSDTDHLIEDHAGKKISEIFLEDGEKVFRNIESQIVGQALARSSGVLALGGGAVMDTSTQALLQAHTALKVFLDVGIGQAATRIGFNQDRPMLLVNPRQTWIALMKIRRPIYESIADVTFTTDSKKPVEVAKEIATLFEAKNG